MQNSNRSIVPAISAGLLVAAFVVSTNGTAPAAEACITKPDLQADARGHWYYRVDRVNHRRCWYLQRSESQVANIGSSEPLPPAPSNQQPGLLSWFSSVVAAITGVSAAGDDQTATVDRSRVIQTSPEVSAKRRTLTVKRADSQEAFTPRLPPPSAPQPLAIFERQTDSLPIDPMKREALYQEFLRWQERRNPW
jgi:hypothetical protein